MIVVAIIGILAQIATPSYSKFIIEQRRADARHLLMANAQLLQRCLTLVGAYDGGCNTITNSNEGHYTLTSKLASQTWSLTAEPVAGGKQLGDTDCATFTLDHTGLKSATGNEPDTCW